MDIYQGRFDFTPPHSTQIHDFNPGFGPEVSPVGGNGFGTRTFWTVAIPDSDLQLDLLAGKVELHVDNLALGDYGKIPVSLGPNFQTAFVPATMSFDIVWSPIPTRMVMVTHGTNGNRFAGSYIEDQATMTWSASEAGFSFTANPGSFATSIPGDAFAELAYEVNGTFFDLTSPGNGAIASALAASSATPANTATPVLASLQLAAGPAAAPAGSIQVIQPPPAPIQPPAGAAHAPTVDQLFADLDGAAPSELF